MVKDKQTVQPNEGRTVKKDGKVGIITKSYATENEDSPYTHILLVNYTDTKTEVLVYPQTEDSSEVFEII